MGVQGMMSSVKIHAIFIYALCFLIFALSGCLVLSSNTTETNLCDRAAQDYFTSLNEYRNAKNYAEEIRNNGAMHPDEEIPTDLPEKAINLFRNESRLINCLQKKATHYAIQYASLPVGARNEDLLNRAIDACMLMNDVSEISIDMLVQGNRKIIVMECFRTIASKTGNTRPCDIGGDLFRNYVQNKFSGTVETILTNLKMEQALSHLNNIGPTIVNIDIERCKTEAKIAEASNGTRPFECYSSYIILFIVIGTFINRLN